MLIVAERINASRAPIREALVARDARRIQGEATSQAQAGADYIDLNGGTFPGQEPELLAWLVDVVQDATDKPLCLDSPDPEALAAALPRVRAPRPMINSISLEPGRFESVLPLVLDHGSKIIALCQAQGPMATSVDRKVDLGSRLVERLIASGVPLDDIYVDPLVFPIATDPASARATLGAVERLMERFPGLHTICGLTNVSYGLPARRLVNRTFLVAAMNRGLDASIIDPTDDSLMASLRAAEAVLGRDEFCMEFLGAFQSGKLN